MLTFGYHAFGIAIHLAVLAVEMETAVQKGFDISIEAYLVLCHGLRIK
jgi:hypothetical protein